MKDVLRLALVLLLICAVVAAVLGGVNELTRERIDRLQAEKTAKAYGAVLQSDEGYEDLQLKAYTQVANGQKIKIDKISRALNGKGYVVETTFSGAQGNISMVIGVNNSFKCTGISVIKHSETSGLGANAASTAEVGVSFRAQFKGQDETIALTKDGGRIDALSGATITSRSVTNATLAAILAVQALG